MRATTPTPNAPPATLSTNCCELPTPWMYLAICAGVPLASCRDFSISTPPQLVPPGSRPPSSHAKSLQTLVSLASQPCVSLGVLLSVVVCSSGPFHVPSAQKTIVFDIDPPFISRFVPMLYAMPSSCHSTKLRPQLTDQTNHFVCAGFWSRLNIRVIIASIMRKNPSAP